MKKVTTHTKSATIQFPHSPLMKRWRDLDETEKRKTAIRIASERDGRAVTLNLSPSFEKLLEASKRPMREVSKRMTEELKRHGIFNLPILLVLEAAKDNGRLHLHGVFIPGDHSIEMIRLAMRKAVGHIHGRPGATQFHETRIYGSDGWHGYITKAYRHTKKHLIAASDPRLWWISQPMTQVAREYHEGAFMAVAANLNNTPANRAG